MMHSKNLYSAIGYLDQKPELQKTPNGTLYARFSMACNYSYCIGDVLMEGVDWIPIVAYGNLAEIAAELLEKGTHICVEARLKPWKSTKNNLTRSGMNIVATEILLVDPKEQSTFPEQQTPTPGDGEAALIADIPD